MMAKNIEKALTQALLHNGEMQLELYRFELEEYLDDWKFSMVEDNDDFLFAVTENNGDVAMVLMEKTGDLHINEDARERLKALWPAAYESNLQMFIPTFAAQLEEGEIIVSGVKIADA